MTMELVQVRLPEAMTTGLDALVHKGLYASKSDVIRDAIRRLLVERQLGTVPDTGDSVTEVRAIRKRLSREKFNLRRINKL